MAFFNLTEQGDRIAIVANKRTPFVKQGSTFANLHAIDLSHAVIQNLLQTSNLSRKDIERVIWGQVIPRPSYPNPARDLVLQNELGHHVDAWSISRACTTSHVAIGEIAAQIASGDISCGIGGGAESTSNAPMQLSETFLPFLWQFKSAKSFKQKIAALKSFKLSHLAIQAPGVRDATVGLSMGEAAELLVKNQHISREAQDAFADASHQGASMAQSEQYLADLIAPIHDVKKRLTTDQDGLIRHDSNLAKYARLKPVFDKQFGTITAANASPMTDGAAGVVLMRESVARSKNIEILGFVRACKTVAHEPTHEMLMGPAYAMPQILNACGLTADDIDIFDFHEAFAGQVLANIAALKDPTFSAKLNADTLGLHDIPNEKINPWGGSIAYGHPFAATGARQVMQAAKMLQVTGKNRVLISACGAGGLGVAMIIEKAES